MQGNPAGVENVESGNPTGPFKNFPPDKDIPTQNTLSVHDFTYDFVGPTHESLHVFRISLFKTAHSSNHGALNSSEPRELIRSQIPAASTP